MSAPVLFTREDFDLVVQVLGIAAFVGGFSAIVLFVDFAYWIDRVRWSRRRRARLARRRARAMTA